MEGLWRQRLTARGTRRPGKRTAWATSAGPAPPNEGGKGMSGPPTSRCDVWCAGTAGWPKRRESHGHRVLVVVRDWESQSHGTGAQVEYDSRGRGRNACCPEAVERAHWRAGSHRKGSVRFGGGLGEKERKLPRPQPLPNLLRRSRFRQRLRRSVRPPRSLILCAIPSGIHALGLTRAA